MDGKKIEHRSRGFNRRERIEGGGDVEWVNVGCVLFGFMISIHFGGGEV
jgi:hypothetical protein